MAYTEILTANGLTEEQWDRQLKQRIPEFAVV